MLTQSLFKSHYLHLSRAQLALIRLQNPKYSSKRVALFYRSLRLVHRSKSTMRQMANSQLSRKRPRRKLLKAILQQQDWLREIMERESPFRHLLITSGLLKWLKLLMIWLGLSLRLSLNCSLFSLLELSGSTRIKRLSYHQEIQSQILNLGN